MMMSMRWCSSADTSGINLHSIFPSIDFPVVVFAFSFFRQPLRIRAVFFSLSWMKIQFPFSIFRVSEIIHQSDESGKQSSSLQGNEIDGKRIFNERINRALKCNELALLHIDPTPTGAARGSLSLTDIVIKLMELTSSTSSFAWHFYEHQNHRHIAERGKTEREKFICDLKIVVTLSLPCDTGCVLCLFVFSPAAHKR